jgi:hypothetical protein
MVNDFTRVEELTIDLRGNNKESEIFLKLSNNGEFDPGSG